MTEFVVLGAGMVGVSTALALQARGHAVTLLDRRSPGRETSFGNAGILQAEAAEPYALPLDARSLGGILLGRTNDVTWTAGAVARSAPALLRYARNSLPARHREISRTYARLTGRATRDHAPLIAAAGAEDLIARDGFAELYRDPAAFAAAEAGAARLSARWGLRHRSLDGAAWRREEPALTADPAGVIHWLDSWSCRDPGALTAAYARLFETRGGRIARGDAADLAQTATGWQAGGVTAEQAVVALGPWSPQLLRRLGYRIAMVRKAGCHGHFRMPVPLRRPFLDAGAGVVAAQMRQGLRITTGAALVAGAPRADLRQLEHGRRSLAGILPLGRRIEEGQWSGTRPCLPDMLPLVGPAPRHHGLWFNFGHGHQGLTLGPTTAEILAALAEDGKAGYEPLIPAGRL
ncbi:NAD(P)/FAD-dependent oxidoreductase [Mangrovicoccus algicola]|uniref:FAD-binding oxidoreductase n=1 Tax=Mangrovicoccus algicola TaxID=2771008 RepID=A0A8J6YSV3_9RHOB|nr:FAD-dependent oxidoreductase [Mangrovicoccus algicola]MBE3636802.1 FAD-binding oxidoreductase [Mangrovicoccus algicola]